MYKHLHANALKENIHTDYDNNMINRYCQ